MNSLIGHNFLCKFDDFKKISCKYGPLYLLTESAVAPSETSGDQSRPREEQQRRQGAISKQPQNYNLTFGGKRDAGFSLEESNFPDLSSNSAKPSPRPSNLGAQSEKSGEWITKTSTEKTRPTDNKNLPKESSDTEWPTVSSSQKGMIKFDQSVAKSTSQSSYASKVAKKEKTQNTEITDYFSPVKK
jgi:hypothetical protein